MGRVLCWVGIHRWRCTPPFRYLLFCERCGTPHPLPGD